MAMRSLTAIKVIIVVSVLISFTLVRSRPSELQVQLLGLGGLW